MIPADLPSDWGDWLRREAKQSYFIKLQDFVAEERRKSIVYPEAELVFEAFRRCPFNRTQVVVMGQDPYHGPGQAHGLSFSVRAGVSVPPSLRNIFRELEADLGLPSPDHGCLTPWAEQGVLLLNSVLTVREGEPGSHHRRGWEQLTDGAICRLSQRREPLVFVLWGRWARQKRELIDTSRHVIIESAHPSPLSARGFFGTRPFSRINEALRRWGRPGVDWRLPLRFALGGAARVDEHRFSDSNSPTDPAAAP